MKKYDIINSFNLDVPDENFFIWIIKLPSPDNISGKGGSSFLEMEHDYQ